MHINKHPYTFYLLALLVGIFLYSYIHISWIWLSMLLFITLVSLIFTVSKIQFRVIYSGLTLVCWILLGIILVKLNTSTAENHYTHFEEKGKIQSLSLILKEQNNSNEKNRKYTAEVTTISYKNQVIHTSGKILLLLDKIEFDSVLILGNEYQLLTRIQGIPPALNPHQFDYKKYLERNYTLRVGSVNKIISQKKHTSLWYWIKNFNQTLVQKIDKSILLSDSKEFLKAFLLGDRSEMKKDTIQNYSKAGIMHLIAISGMHIAFIFSIFISVISFFFGSNNRNKVIVCSLFSVWLFGCFVGLSSSVFRACLMITIYYAFELLKRIPNIYHSLSLSAILILLSNPYEIYSIGFQLSYLAVFFMSWLGPFVTQYLKTKNKKANQWIVKPLAITLVAQLGTMPFAIYYFHQFSLLSILANIFIIPYTVVITYSSLIELAVIFLPDKFQFYFSIFYDFIVAILIEGTHWISSVHLLLFRHLFLSRVEIISLVFAIVLLKYFLRKPNFKNILPFLICIAIFRLSSLVNEYKSGQKENFIVFHNRYPLVGFREGRYLLVLKDEKDNLEKLNSFIIDSYITGERINKVEYKTIDYQKLYRWKSVSIQFLNKENDKIVDSVDYLVVEGTPQITIDESANNIIFTGNVYAHYLEKIGNMPNLKIWITKEKGFFISPP